MDNRNSSHSGIIYKFVLLMYYLHCFQTGRSADYINLRGRYSDDILNESFLDTLIEKHKYPAERHYVTTEDGYILQMHRIAKKKVPPLLLMHGIMDSSSTWVILGPTSAFGYFLYNNGFDVWLGNARGNRYSRNHTYLQPNSTTADGNFWDFSWHEIGYYDLPAMIDYILKETGFTKLGYIGHSQGCTNFFVMTSLRTNYNDKISIMHAIAPVAFLNNLHQPLLSQIKLLSKFKTVKNFEFLPSRRLFWDACLSTRFTEMICLEFINLIFGRDNEAFNRSLLPTIIGHYPSGGSFRQMDHFLQLVASKRFCQYDYGKTNNIQRYGQAQPPDYPLRNITPPIALYYSSNDNICSVIDIERLARLLPNIYESYLFPIKTGNHLCMLYGLNARRLAHQRIVYNLKRFINT